MPTRIDGKSPLRPVEKGWLARAWKESHGNWLLAFAACVFVGGIGLIWSQPPAEESLAPDLTADRQDVALDIPDNMLFIRVLTDSADEIGPIRIAIYDSAEAFGDPEMAISKDSLLPSAGAVNWKIELDQLPSQFSVAAYHDLDNNGELNRGLFNAPTEPYGFSNNARTLLGPPTFEQTLVTKPSESSVLELRVY